MEIKRVNYEIEGNKLSVLEAGDKSNPVVVFVHGIPANAKLWESTMKKLAKKGYYTLAFDLPGFGGTVITKEEDYSLKNAAKLANKWLVEQGHKDIWLVSHDIGGGVTQIMLILNESIYKKATISNSIAGDSWPVPAILQLTDAAKAGQFVDFAASGELAKNLGPFIISTFEYKENITEEKLNSIFLDSKFTTEEGRAKFNTLLTKLDNQDTIEIMDDLKKIDIPVHLIWGMTDPHQPWGGPGVMLQNAFKNVEVDKIEVAGHFLQQDAHDDYYKLLTKNI